MQNLNMGDNIFVNLYSATCLFIRLNFYNEWQKIVAYRELLLCWV